MADHHSSAPRQPIPFQQGGLDCLCGIYSIVNAIQLAAAPQLRISGPQSHALFAHLCSYLESRAKLSRAASSGIGGSLMRKCLKQAFAWLHEEADLALRFERPFVSYPDAAFDDVRASIARHLAKPGTSVLVAVIGMNHWTVISAVGKSYFHLFNSRQQSRLYFRHIKGAVPDVHPAPHEIGPGGIYMIGDQSSDGRR